ncbi:hypothetical protein [Haloglomus litoreum]|uniref:hypothetical protein n=1 Tax=Haloglomus litoreum TaxID=3034026 RepID=UPI0023E7CC05|nr:hypothetical protein [Haloglomus sp. DT116]
MSDDPAPEQATESATDTDAEPPANDSPDPAMSTDTTDTTARTEPPADDPPTDDTDEEGRDLVRYARYALLGGLTLLALVATLRFYFAASNAIDIWVARQYRPLFQAAFNLVVLLLAAIGISWEVRKVAA